MLHILSLMLENILSTKIQLSTLHTTPTDEATHAGHSENPTDAKLTDSEFSN